MTAETTGIDLSRQIGKQIHIVFSEISSYRIKCSTVNSLKSAILSASAADAVFSSFPSSKAIFFILRPTWYQKLT